MYSRRLFIKVVGATGAVLCLPGKGIAQQIMAQPANPLLDPAFINQFVTPLLIPPVMPMAGTINSMMGQNIDY